MSISIAKRRAREARTAAGLEEKLNYLADAIYQISEALGEMEQQLKRGAVPSAVPTALGREGAGSRTRSVRGSGNFLKSVFSKNG